MAMVMAMEWLHSLPFFLLLCQRRPTINFAYFYEPMRTFTRGTFQGELLRAPQALQAPTEPLLESYFWFSTKERPGH